MSRKPKDPEEAGTEPGQEQSPVPETVTAADITPLPVEAPKPRRKRRSREEIAQEKAALSEAQAAEYRGQAAMIVDMADAVLAQNLPPPLAPHERAVLEPALARYMQAEQAAISPGWALVGALIVIVAPRVIAAYQRHRRAQFTVLPGGAKVGNDDNGGPAPQSASCHASDTGAPPPDGGHG